MFCFKVDFCKRVEVEILRKREKYKVVIIKEVSLCCKITRYSGQAQSELTMKLFSCLSSNALLVVILRENNSFYLSLEAVNIA